MAKPSTVKLVQHLTVTPEPPNPNYTPSLPLTFLDIPWLLFPPTKPLFFFTLPTQTTHHHLLRALHLSLSHSLALFYPLAGALLLPPPPRSPAILCAGDDSSSSVSFSVAESDGDFDSLSSHYSRRDAKEFHKLVPELKTIVDHDDDDGTTIVPLMAVQVTVFPNSGLSLGLAIHHVVADGRTFNNFMKVWSSFSRDLMSPSSDPERHSLTVADYDRSAIVDSLGLEGVFLKEWWGRRNLSRSLWGGAKMSNSEERVRATFIVGPGEMERVKRWIVMAQLPCSKGSQPRSLHLSPYVLACSLVWASLVKAQHHSGLRAPARDPNYFGFIAGGRTRMGYPVPEGYIGNCVGFGRAEASRGELLGEDGVLAAARAIGSTIKRLDKAVFGGAEKWISEWEVVIGSDIHVMVCGSPKVDLYGRDFGVGGPRKIEEVEIDSGNGISLCESRDVKGGMEFGLVLPNPQMDAFSIFFNDTIKHLSSY